MKATGGIAWDIIAIKAIRSRKNIRIVKESNKVCPEPTSDICVCSRWLNKRILPSMNAESCAPYSKFEVRSSELKPNQGTTREQLANIKDWLLP